MKIIKRNRIKDRLSSLLRRSLNRLENSDNCNMTLNGEESLIKQFCASVISNGKRSGVIFDIGANIGNYSEMFIREARKNDLRIIVHAFEPSKPTFARLKDRFKDRSDIIFVNSGLSDKKEDRLLYADRNEDNSGGSSLYDRKVMRGHSKTPEMIHLMRLDGYIEERRVAHIDFMKMDVEGHELSVLKGMRGYLRPDFVDLIQFEFGGCDIDSGTTLKELGNLLEKRGFIIGKVMPHSIEVQPLNARPVEDYFYSNYVAINPRWLSPK